MNSVQAEPSGEDIIRVLLQNTGQLSPPTNVEAIVDYLKFKIYYFPPREFGLDPRIKAFLWPKRRSIGVDIELTEVQQRFSILHEVGHLVLPGHVTHPELLDQDERITDDSLTLSNTSGREKKVYTMEVEANQFAADCLFQLEHFDHYIQTKELDWTNILFAADLYMASIEATARRWVERTHEPKALVAFNPVDRKQPSSPLEIFYTITSSPFSAKYFSGLQKGQRMSANSAVSKLHYRLENLGNEAEEILRVQMQDDVIEEFHMQLFSNSYRVFGILTPMSAE